MKIRKGKPGDLKSVAEIYSKAYSEGPYFETWNEKDLVEKLKEDHKRAKIYVAEVERKIAGFIMFYIYDWHDGKRAYIEDFAISKEYRGTGIGKALMNKVEEDCKKIGIDIIVLEVHTNSDALKMYEKLGYKNAGYIRMEKKLK